MPSLAACGTGTSRADGAGAKTKTLVVRNSGGAYGEALQKAVYEPFTKETGIQVQVVNVQYAQMLAQIKQGRPQFDLIDNSMMDFLKFVGEDAMEKLDHDRLKSFKARRSRATWSPTTPSARASRPASWRTAPTPSAARSRVLGGLLGHQGVPRQPLAATRTPTCPSWSSRCSPTAYRWTSCTRSTWTAPSSRWPGSSGPCKKFWDTRPLPGVLLSRKEVAMSTVWHGRLARLISRASRGLPVRTAPAGSARAMPSPRAPPTSTPPTSSSTSRCAPRRQAALAKIFPIGPVVPGGLRQALRRTYAPTCAAAPEYLDQGFDLDVDWWLKNEDAVNKRWLEWARG